MAGAESRSLPAGAFVARLSAGALRGARSCVVAAALWAPTCMLVGSPPVGLNNGRAHRRLLRSIVGAILALALSLCARATGATGAAGATRKKLVNGLQNTTSEYDTYPQLFWQVQVSTMIASPSVIRDWVVAGGEWEGQNVPPPPAQYMQQP